MKVLFKIKHGRDNSRFLFDDNKSGLISNSENLEVGMNIDPSKVKELDIAKTEWIEKYEKYNNNVENIIPHMTAYKKANSKLKELPKGSYKNKEYDHILPEEKKELNLLDSPFKDNLKKEYQLLEERKELHKGFSHLNSSQAFALNFFVPLMNDVHLFSEFLKKNDLGKIEEKVFEKVLDKNEGTQLDFYLKTDKKEFTFEIKYSENAFGDTEQNERHEIKYDNIYKNRLAKVTDNLTKEEFFEEYQLWRNICFAGEGKEVRFVFPKFRKDLGDKVNEAKAKCKENIRGLIDFIYVDDLVNKMRESNNENLKKHYEEFYEKYLNLNSL